MAFLPSCYGLLCSLIVINVLFETGVAGSSNKSNPLEADDILKKHTFGNHHQCQRLCWYIELCEQFSFYTKNLDDAHPANCVLHAGDEKDEELEDGWMQEKASGDYLPSQHGCRTRICGKDKVCVPLAMPDVTNVCNDLPADVNECASSPCQNGSCVDGDRAYTCNCFPGYTGVHCETDIDECLSNPCQNNGSCVDQVNAYTCNCLAGYNGSSCTDIDECFSDPCQNGGVCVDQVNNYTCNCSAGYNGSNCATDIDECFSDPCQNGGSCEDQVNNYTCNCPAGYNGSNCETDIDECFSNPCQNNGSCVDEVNAYTCNCSAGYNGSNCETDIDECFSNPCQNNGRCVDQVNAYTCNCLAGYNGSNCATDIDECESNPCPSGEDCEDTINGYNCCPPGYSGTTCNESWLKATCTTTADCTKVKTECYSGHCLCKDGYFFSHSTDACVQTCELLDTNYLYYKDLDLTGSTHARIHTTNSTTCAAQCSSDPQCITFILYQGGCYMKSFTGQGPEGFWQAKTNARMYQRTCE